MRQLGKKLRIINFTTQILFCAIIFFLSNSAHSSEDYIVAATIQDLSSGQIVYSKNANTRLQPGSTIKLLTAHTTLQELGSDFTFKTTLYTHNNEYYLKFRGDPTLTLTDLDDILKHVKAHNINIDASEFYYERASNGRSFESQKFCYGAPVSSIIINKNCSPLKLEGNKYKPDSQWAAEIIYNYTISDSDNCHLDLREDGPNEYSLNGCTKTPPARLLVAISDPEKLLAQYLKSKGHNVQFTKTPESAKIAHEHNSQKIINLVKIMLKESDNMIADSLAKAAAAKAYRVQGSFNLASKFLNNAASEISTSNINIVDGSGVSAKNFVTTNFMTHLLTRMHSNGEMDYLPINKLSAKFGNAVIFAKSGSLDNLSALSGFFQNNERIYAFSFIISNHNLPKEEIINRWLSLFSQIYDKNS